MPRGRPRKVPVEPVSPESLEWEVAQVLAKSCGVPGCLPKNHMVEATQLVIIMKDKYNLK
jgi:hypothetical protein